MGKNINTGIWTVDNDGITQTVADLFTGGTPVYTHADHIDNSFNFCVNGVSEQNSRMCLHMTNRGDNEYTVEDVANVFIPDLIYDNKGNIGAQAINTVLGNGTGGVSNFAIEPDSGNQPSADFKIHPSFDYRTALWFPRIGFAKYSDISNRYNIGYTYYSLNQLDEVSTAEDADPDETWWEYYTRNSSDYVMCMNAYSDGQYYTGGSFDSTAVFEGQTRFGFAPAWVCWLSTPYYWGYSYGTAGCYYYFDNGQGRYSDLTFDVIFSLSSDAMTKIDEYDDTYEDSYHNPYPRHNIVYTPKISKDLILRLICSYGLPFSFSHTTTSRTFADPDYALPVILNNTTTGEYVRGSDCITADTENNRWINTADIDNKPAGGGGGGGTDEDNDDPISTNDAPYGTGLAHYYSTTAGSVILDHISEAMGTWDIDSSKKDLYRNLISCKLIKPPAPIPTTGSENFTIYGVQPLYQGNPVSLPVVSGNPSATFGSYSISRKFNDFRDFAPYSKAEIFLPYCGWTPLPSHVIGRSVSVKYFTDIIAATCKAVVFCGNNVVAEAAGIIGLDIPFAAENVGAKMEAANMGLLSSTLGAVQTAVGVGTMVSTKSGSGLKNVTSGLSQVISGCTQISMAGNENWTEINGKAGDGCSLAGIDTIIIKITRPKYGTNAAAPFVPSGYAHNIGFVAMKQTKPGSIKGLLVCDNVDTSGISGATERERNLIKAYLESGIIVE